MTKQILLSGLYATLLQACNNIKTKETEGNEETVANESSAQPFDGCYMYAVGKDTVYLKLAIDNNNVSGKLDYNMFEKDSRHGTIQGVLDKNNIKAEYTYSAEGTTSKQQLWLKIRNKKVYEGHGDMKEENNGFVYTDTNHIEYDQAFEKTQCR